MNIKCTQFFPQFHGPICVKSYPRKGFDIADTMEQREKLQVFLLGSEDTKRYILSVLNEEHHIITKLLDIAKRFDGQSLKVLCLNRWNSAQLELARSRAINNLKKLVGHFVLAYSNLVGHLLGHKSRGHLITYYCAVRFSSYIV